MKEIYYFDTSFGQDIKILITPPPTAEELQTSMVRAREVDARRRAYLKKAFRPYGFCGFCVGS